MKIETLVQSTLSDPCRHIRQRVFVEEQHFENEFDELDQSAIHLLLLCDGEPAATARLFPGEQSGDYLIGRVAVLPQYRKEHLGSKIMRFAEQEAIARGASRIILSAQCRVRPFYESLGYTASGPIYYDEYCEHIHMEKYLKSKK